MKSTFNKDHLQAASYEAPTVKKLFEERNKRNTLYILLPKKKIKKLGI